MNKLSSVSRKTITEIENSKQGLVLVQENTFKKLKEALGISSNEMLENTLKSKLSDTTQNATHINASQDDKDSSAMINEHILRVAQIYGCDAEDIIALAPLLAMDFFEKCLEKEMKLFSKKFKNNKLTRGSEYILENFFTSLSITRRNTTQRKILIILYILTKKKMENNMYKGFDMLLTLKYLERRLICL